jgi:superoxide dismutase, Fe-Mn family
METTQDNSPINRREALAMAGIAGVAALSIPALARGDVPGSDLLGFNSKTQEYEVPPLPYEYNALEPHIDEQTMHIHHDKHHAGYVRGLNRALKNLDAIRAGTGDASLIKHWSRELAYHGSGHVNHTLFWRNMSPRGGGQPIGSLATHINKDFGSHEHFSNHFQAAARSVEGSGWAWLALEPMANKLLVMQTEKQQNMASMGVIPLLGVDVWEHAYYLHYQNRRADYVKAFMRVINWPFVASQYDRASG